MPAIIDENANPNLADNILMIPQKSLEKLRGGDLTNDDIVALISPEGLADKEMVVPTDLRGISDNFEEEFEDDFEVMMDKLGPKGTAEGILKAHEYWEQNKGGEPADKRAKALTAEDWKELTGDDDEDEDEDEEDAGDDAEGEGEDAEGDEEVEDEPAAKKAKTA